MPIRADGISPRLQLESENGDKHVAGAHLLESEPGFEPLSIALKPVLSVVLKDFNILCQILLRNYPDIMEDRC